MARQKKAASPDNTPAENTDNSSAIAPDAGVTIPRISVNPQGFDSLRTMTGRILEEQNLAFRYPAFSKAISEMSADPTIMAALNIYRMLMSRVPWYIKPPENATEIEKERAKILQSMQDDMEGTWGQFISEVITYLPYGFAVMEKVYRRRLNRNGSKFNDGVVGIRRLSPRPQETISKWLFSEDGRDLLGVGQSLKYMENGGRYSGLTDAKDGLIHIDREKFLLFSCDSTRGNPEGKSILKAVYLPYKQLTLMKDQLFLGIAKDLAAIPIVGLPAKMMDPNADPADKAAYQAYQQLVNNVAAGTQRGIIMPLMYDPETKAKLFDFELLEAKGQSKFDLPAIIKQLQNDIFVALSADVITFGSDIGDNFSLGDSRTNLTSLAASHRLNEIRDVLNSDLIRQIYSLNGWSQDRLPTFEYGDVSSVSMDEIGKLIQRVVSVGAVPIDIEMINRIREVMGITTLPADTKIEDLNMPLASSKAGEGMQQGKSGNGTAKIGGNSSGQDSSANNANNAE